MSEFYSYKMVRDYGFAPNPFHGLCTLATCKPHIRIKASVGDWVIGTGAKTTNLEGCLIYAMLVTEKVTFEQYWSDPQYSKKKPLQLGGLKRIHGDNIYYIGDDNQWHQIPSQHSNPDFSENLTHAKTDLSGKFVLISNHFYYFGDRYIQMPKQFLPLCSTLRDYTKIKNVELAMTFVQHLKEQYEIGVVGDPINWKEYYQRRLF